MLNCEIMIFKIWEAIVFKVQKFINSIAWKFGK